MLSDISQTQKKSTVQSHLSVDIYNLFLKDHRNREENSGYQRWGAGEQIQIRGYKVAEMQNKSTDLMCRIKTIDDKVVL